MSLSVKCECGLKYKVREDNRGKFFRCQGCGAQVAVPNADDTADEEWGSFDESEFESPEDDPVEASGEQSPFGKKTKRKSSASRAPARGKEPLMKTASRSDAVPDKKLLLMGAAGIGGLIAIGVVFMLMAGGGGKKPAGDGKIADGPDASGSIQPNGANASPQKLEPVDKKNSRIVVDATPAKGLSASSLVASAKPPQNWSVKISEFKPPENLGSLWRVPNDGTPQGFVTPRLLTTTDSHAALLTVPNEVQPGKLFAIDLAKPNEVAKGIDLPPPESPGAAPQIPLSMPGQIWLGNPDLRYSGKLRPRDRNLHVAAINSSFSKVANGLYSNTRMQIWDDKGTRLASIEARDRSHWVFAHFPKDDLLNLIAAEGTARTVDPTNGQVVHETRLDWMGSVALTPDWRYVVGCSKSAIEFRDSSTLELAGSLPLPDDLVKMAKVVGPSLDVSADGLRLAALFVANDTFMLLTWDLATGKLTDAYLRKAYESDVWVQWVGKRRLVIGFDNQIFFSVLDLDLKTVLYTARYMTPVSSVDGRIWRFTDGHSSREDWVRQLHQKLGGDSTSKILPPLLLAGTAVTDRIDKFAAGLKGLPVNRNVPVRVEVVGRDHWPLKETANGFAEYLSKHGFTVDPNAKTVYRLVLRYQSVAINYSGMVGPSVGGDPGVQLSAELDQGPGPKHTTIVIYRGYKTFAKPSKLAPPDLTVEQWESKYPDATKGAREHYAKYIQTVMEGNAPGLRGVGTSSDGESFYLADGDFASIHTNEGDFPVDGYFEPQ